MGFKKKKVIFSCEEEKGRFQLMNESNKQDGLEGNRFSDWREEERHLALRILWPIQMKKMESDPEGGLLFSKKERGLEMACVNRKCMKTG